MRSHYVKRMLLHEATVKVYPYIVFVYFEVHFDCYALNYISFAYRILMFLCDAQVDLVTETDKACEELIFNNLKQLYPTHKVDSYLLQTEQPYI